jgi:electron transfer flavoprotein alpha subunit
MFQSKGTYRDMWVFAESHEGKFLPVSLEMLGEARRLMDGYNATYQTKEKVVAVVLGESTDALAKEALERGADAVYTCDHPELKYFRLEPYTHVVTQMAQGRREGKDYDKPRYFLFPATNNGRDLSATAMAVMESGLASDCNHLEIRDIPIKHPVKTRIGEQITEVVYPRILHMKRPDFSGFEWSTILCIDDPDKDFHPQACSVIPGSFKALEPRPNPSGLRVKHEFKLPEKALRVKIRKHEKLAIEADLTPHEVIVALGRGIGPAPTDGIKVGLELAKTLGGDVGITRGVVTAQYAVDPSVGQFTKEIRQIGETGQTVKPKVYVALGVSGAIQHKKGMDKAKFIVSVNTDETAPIKEFSDVFVRGDLFKVAPKLRALVESRKGGANGGNV